MRASPRRRTAAASFVALVSAAAVVAGGLALAETARAAAIDVPQTGEPGRLVLSSEPYPAQFLDLSPGEWRYWQVTARLENADAATLALEVRASGELAAHPRGLRMAIAACAAPWSTGESAPACATGARAVTLVTPADVTASSPTFRLEPLGPGVEEHLLVTLGVEDSAAARTDASLMHLTGDMALGLTATAFDPPPSPHPSLPATGVDASLLGGLAALAAGMIGLGAAMRLRREVTR